VMNNVINVLSSVELFNGLKKSELELIEKNISSKSYQQDEYLFKENSPRNAIFIIKSGEVSLGKKDDNDKILNIVNFYPFDFFGEGALTENSVHSTTAQAVVDSVILSLDRHFFIKNAEITLKIFSNIINVVSRRMKYATLKSAHSTEQYSSGKKRKEHDLLGYREVPDEYYYGIQTMRAMENFNISGITLNSYPLIINALATVKKAAALANFELKLLSKDITDAIVQACDEIINKKYHFHFVVDMIQGGAGTSTNMNANEVIANRALQIMGYKKGEYEYCHPNNHVNLSQSTNDVYPTALKIALINSNKKIIPVLKNLFKTFRAKGVEFSEVIKIGRTQLQDAVPMTLGQEFEAWAVTLEEEVDRIEQNTKLLLEVNMGATAIGTGINADPEYGGKVIKHLRKITKMDIKLASNLVEATQDTGSFIMFSSAIKRLATKLSKISNDLRLLSSGPRAGFNEINLPPVQPGSSIMPGKVNPVIPEVVNQIAFKVIGNDLTVTLASEAGQLELNAMEPVIIQSLFESIDMLINGMNTLNYKCVKGITANIEICRAYVENSIGLVTALNPVLGYETCSLLAKQALEENSSVYDLVLQKNLLSKKDLDKILAPENMLTSKKL
ncbi:aspartate ammonia-lyase, partial [Bacteroidota bacterium]